MRIRPQIGTRKTALVVGLVAAGLACAVVSVWLFVFRQETVPASTWARSVCSALTPWKTKVAELTATAREEMGKTGSPAQTQTTLTTLLSGAEDASDQARSQIVSAGIPDVDEGSATSQRFVSALTHARDAYGHARTTIAGLPVVEETAFYDGVADAFVTLNEEYEASTLDISTVGPAELRNSFDEVSECQ